MDQIHSRASSHRNPLDTEIPALEKSCIHRILPSPGLGLLRWLTSLANDVLRDFTTLKTGRTITILRLGSPLDAANRTKRTRINASPQEFPNIR
jgi:hypothetical protein